MLDKNPTSGLDVTTLTAEKAILLGNRRNFV